MQISMYCTRVADKNRPKRCNIKGIMGLNSIVELLGRYWSYFELNVLARDRYLK